MTNSCRATVTPRLLPRAIRRTGSVLSVTKRNEGRKNSIDDTCRQPNRVTVEESLFWKGEGESGIRRGAHYGVASGAFPIGPPAYEELTRPQSATRVVAPLLGRGEALLFRFRVFVLLAYGAVDEGVRGRRCMDRRV